MTSAQELTAPAAGRLLDPTLSPATDPRIHPQQRAALAMFGLDVLSAPPPVTRASAPDERTAFLAAAEEGFMGLYAAIPNDLVGDDFTGVERSTSTITGVDGNEITLHVFRPAGSTGPLPGVVYLHGGGMTILKTVNSVHSRWCEAIASTGTVTILVDFRNAFTVEGMNPFPAGLNDCASAVAWIHANRDRLGMSSLVLQGESGGANLCLATTLKAKRDGTLDAIDGVYATVPFISGGYGWDTARKVGELPSLVENDGYFIETTLLDLLAACYDPTGEHAGNPLAWPYHATEEDVAGLPPHVVSVNELDPLRDEGTAYWRLLARAGVPVVGRVNLGLVHAAESIFRQALPAVYAATVADIHRFAARR